MWVNPIYLSTYMSIHLSVYLAIPCQASLRHIIISR